MHKACHLNAGVSARVCRITRRTLHTKPSSPATERGDAPDMQVWCWVDTIGARGRAVTYCELRSSNSCPPILASEREQTGSAIRAVREREEMCAPQYSLIETMTLGSSTFGKTRLDEAVKPRRRREARKQAGRIAMQHLPCCMILVDMYWTDRRGCNLCLEMRQPCHSGWPSRCDL